MYFLIYVSSAVNLFSDEELTKLLEVSRRNNHRRGISGLLLYQAGNFMQVLEGAEKDVLETHGRISFDPRHTGLITLMQGQREGRDFEDWSMGFKKLDGPDPGEIPGHSDFLETPLNSPVFTGNPSHAVKLLSLFKKNMR
jgi:hypothetical protein